MHSSALLFDPAHKIKFSWSGGQTGQLVALLHVTNISDEDKYYFKVKATDTQHFRVNPTIGNLAPQSSLTFLFEAANKGLLNKSDDAQLAEAVESCRFLIKLIKLPATSRITNEEVWNVPLLADKSERKILRCKLVKARSETESRCATDASVSCVTQTDRYQSYRGHQSFDQAEVGPSHLAAATSNGDALDDDLCGKGDHLQEENFMAIHKDKFDEWPVFHDENDFCPIVRPEADGSDKVGKNELKSDKIVPTYKYEFPIRGMTPKCCIQNCAQNNSNRPLSTGSHKRMDDEQVLIRRSVPWKTKIPVLQHRRGIASESHDRRRVHGDVQRSMQPVLGGFAKSNPPSKLPEQQALCTGSLIAGDFGGLVEAAANPIDMITSEGLVSSARDCHNNKQMCPEIYNVSAIHANQLDKASSGSSPELQFSDCKRHRENCLFEPNERPQSTAEDKFSGKTSHFGLTQLSQKAAWQPFFSSRNSIPSRSSPTPEYFTGCLVCNSRRRMHRSPNSLPLTKPKVQKNIQPVTIRTKALLQHHYRMRKTFASPSISPTSSSGCDCKPAIQNEARLCHIYDKSTSVPTSLADNPTLSPHGGREREAQQHKSILRKCLNLKVSNDAPSQKTGEDAPEVTGRGSRMKTLTPREVEQTGTPDDNEISYREVDETYGHSAAEESRCWEQPTSRPNLTDVTSERRCCLPLRKRCDNVQDSNIQGNLTDPGQRRVSECRTGDDYKEPQLSSPSVYTAVKDDKSESRSAVVRFSQNGLLPPISEEAGVNASRSRSDLELPLGIPPTDALEKIKQELLFLETINSRTWLSTTIPSNKRVKQRHKQHQQRHNPKSRDVEKTISRGSFTSEIVSEMSTECSIRLRDRNKPSDDADATTVEVANDILHNKADRTEDFLGSMDEEIEATAMPLSMYHSSTEGISMANQSATPISNCGSLDLFSNSTIDADYGIIDSVMEDTLFQIIAEDAAKCVEAIENSIGDSKGACSNTSVQEPSDTLLQSILEFGIKAERECFEGSEAITLASTVDFQNEHCDVSTVEAATEGMHRMTAGMDRSSDTSLVGSGDNPMSNPVTVVDDGMESGLPTMERIVSTRRQNDQLVAQVLRARRINITLRRYLLGMLTPTQKTFVGSISVALSNGIGMIVVAIVAFTVGFAYGRFQ